jgi:hypothetical protein
VRPPLPSRTANRASSMSRRGRGLVPRAACSEPLGRSIEPDVRVGVPPSRQGTIQTGASWMCAAKYSAASSSRRNRSRLMPGAGSPARYRGATCSSHARLYKALTVSLTFGSRTTRNRQRCMFPPLGAHTPVSKIFRICSFGDDLALAHRGQTHNQLFWTTMALYDFL